MGNSRASAPRWAWHCSWTAVADRSQTQRDEAIGLKTAERFSARPLGGSLSIALGAQQKKGHYVENHFLACLGRRGDCHRSRPYDDF